MDEYVCVIMLRLTQYTFKYFTQVCLNMLLTIKFICKAHFNKKANQTSLLDKTRETITFMLFKHLLLQSKCVTVGTLAFIFHFISCLLRHHHAAFFNHFMFFLKPCCLNIEEKS